MKKENTSVNINGLKVTRLTKALLSEGRMLRFQSAVPFLQLLKSEILIVRPGDRPSDASCATNLQKPDEPSRRPGNKSRFPTVKGTH